MPTASRVVNEGLQEKRKLRTLQNENGAERVITGMKGKVLSKAERTKYQSVLWMAMSAPGKKRNGRFCLL